MMTKTLVCKLRTFTSAAEREGRGRGDGGERAREGREVGERQGSLN